MTGPKESPKKTVYAGPLATPVSLQWSPPVLVPRVDHVDMPATVIAEAQRLTKKFGEKLPLLFDHFGISQGDSDRWQQLAFKLALEHVPGFQIVATTKSGAPQSWDSLELVVLFCRVESLAKQGMTAMDACRALIRLPDGGWRFPRSRNAKTLYRRYQQAKKLALCVFISSLSDPKIKERFQEAIVRTVENHESGEYRLSDFGSSEDWAALFGIGGIT